MIQFDLLNMNDIEIENMCDVIKKLSRVSHWKILQALLVEWNKKGFSGSLNRQQLIDITANTNIGEDIKFLLQQELIVEITHYPKAYCIGNTELINFQTATLKKLMYTI